MKTALEIAIKVLNRQTKKGIKHNGKNVYFSEVVCELEKLLQAVGEGRLQTVGLCKTCKNFSQTVYRNRGCCFIPIADYTCSRRCADFCSLWKGKANG